MESTYGDRNRDEEGDRTEQLFTIIDRTLHRRGKVIIPSFAVGRTQEVLARINDLVEAERLPGLRVFVDSPMAVAGTKAFVLHPEAYSATTRQLLAEGDAPLAFDGLRLITSVEESIALNRSDEPAVIISASGMCTAGRVKHHLKFQHLRLAGHRLVRRVSGSTLIGTRHPIRNLVRANLWRVVSGQGADRDNRGLLGPRRPR